MLQPLEISNVWTRVDHELESDIIAFWSEYKMLPPGADANDRAGQVVLTVRHQGKIVGLTSSDVVRFRQLNDNIFFLFRMVVLPEFRVPGIESKLIVTSRDILEAYAEKQTMNKCVGMLTFVENPQLIAKRREAVWPASKMVFIGNDKAGRQIRVYYFKGATI